MVMDTQDSGIDLTRAVWRKSTRSGPFTDNCVEVAFYDGGAVAVRDSKDPSARCWSSPGPSGSRSSVAPRTASSISRQVR